ncbi:MAG: 3'-5' exonuclease, partial [Pseudomonadota bacterium]|nr:3'-5' exonuclease [Pseudomonadota bacterium]
DINTFRKVFSNRTGITVSSIHGVKGGEFDTVIAYALLEDMVPHFSDPEKESAAKKMLYVIGSRARKNLHLISERGRQKGHNRGMYDTTKELLKRSYEYNDI